jgi:hypothetical protein
MIAVDDGRLAAILLKLNGVIEKTKPSKGLTSLEFHMPDEDTGGCRSSYISLAY